MSLADDYRRQLRFREWDRALAALPDVRGATVLDLGCAVGDQAAALAARGARVIGFDLDGELLEAARGRTIPGVELHRADLRSLPDPGVLADGIWCSLAAAYFVDLADVVRGWSRYLRAGGWIAVTEVDDLFGHEPIAPRTRELLDAYAADALAARRYDFHMGGRVPAHLERAGLAVAAAFDLPDRELAFDGPADPDVLDAWRTRLLRMRLLRDFCGVEMHAVERDLLGCLARTDHRSRARVRFVLARVT